MPARTATDDWFDRHDGMSACCRLGVCRLGYRTSRCHSTRCTCDCHKEDQ